MRIVGNIIYDGVLSVTRREPLLWNIIIKMDKVHK